MKPSAMEVPRTATADGRAVGARQAPSCCALFWCTPCAISGYISGDPTEGCCEGAACVALAIEIITGCGCIYGLLCWKPNPAEIKGDGTQRTVANTCCAGCLLGCAAIGFYERGDLVCDGDGGCTWCQGDALIAFLLNLLSVLLAPIVMVIGPIGDCYVCCCWQAKQSNFARHTAYHGGGASLVGAPVQAANMCVALGSCQGAMGGQPVVAQAVVVGNSS